MTKLTLIKNDYMIELDLQHRSLAKLYVVSDRVTLSERYSELYRRIKILQNNHTEGLTFKQFNQMRNGKTIEQVTKRESIIARYYHIENLRVELNQLGNEIDLLIDLEQAG